MPLTDDGFVENDWNSIRDQQEQQIKSEFGSDIDTSSGSVFGHLIDYQTNLRVNDESKHHDTYDSNFTDTATGVQLDRRAANSGVQRNQAQLAEVNLVFTGQPGYVIDENSEFLTDNADSFFTEQDLQLDSNGNGNVNALSENAEEAANVNANTIVNQANPVDEITSVNNPNAAYGGADLESDYYLRNRLKQNDKSTEGPTRDGINTAILNVPGVFGVTVQDNYSNTTDENNNPPHSMHIYVSGGNPDEIANKLANNSVGATTGSIKRDVDIDGSIRTVRFDMAQTLQLYFKVGIKTSEGYDHDATVESVIDYVSDFDMGEPIILNKLYSYLYQLNGVSEVTSIQASTDGKNFSTDNLQLAKYQVAKTTENEVEVDTNE